MSPYTDAPAFQIRHKRVGQLQVTFHPAPPHRLLYFETEFDYEDLMGGASCMSTALSSALSGPSNANDKDWGFESKVPAPSVLVVVCVVGAL